MRRRYGTVRVPVLIVGLRTSDSGSSSPPHSRAGLFTDGPSAPWFTGTRASVPCKVSKLQGPSGLSFGPVKLASCAPTVCARQKPLRREVLDLAQRTWQQARAHQDQELFFPF